MLLQSLTVFTIIIFQIIHFRQIHKNSLVCIMVKVNKRRFFLMTAITIKETDTYILSGSLYENTAADTSDVLGTLIYLHGGGLVFGEKTDLPSEYLEVLRRRFNVLAADYRLAPESEDRKSTRLNSSHVS